MRHRRLHSYRTIEDAVSEALGTFLHTSNRLARTNGRRELSTISSSSDNSKGGAINHSRYQARRITHIGLGIF